MFLHVCKKNIVCKNNSFFQHLYAKTIRYVVFVKKMLKNYIPTTLLQITQVLQDIFFSYHVLGWHGEFDEVSEN